MNKVKDSYNVNSMTQIAGEAALRDRDHFDWLVASTIKEREWVQARVREFGWEWPKSDGNFMLLELRSVELASAIYARLKHAGVLVRYWGNRPDLNSKLRLTVGARESNEKFVTLVAKALEEPEIAKLLPAANGKQANGSR